MDKKDLSHIRRVDIEIQSYCNRKCAWCPNKTFDRSFREEMPDGVYTSLLQQLDEAGFGRNGLQGQPIRNSDEQLPTDTPVLSFIGYQECFSDIDYTKRRLNEAREILNDRVCFVTSSNGDFITKKSLENLLFTNIGIQDYDNKGLTYWENKFKELGILKIGYTESLGMLYGIHRYTESITVKLNWAEHQPLQNRGGFFKHGDLPNMKWQNDMRLRTAPCPEPEYYMNICYDGSVMPCCHLRPDNPEHKKYILGNIKDTPLVDIYYSEKAENFRKVLRQENGEYHEACLYCQKIRRENCLGSPSGWNYFCTKYQSEVNNA